MSSSIAVVLLLIDELRLLRERIAEARNVPVATPPNVEDPKMLDVKRAAEYLGVSTSFIRNVAAQRKFGPLQAWWPSYVSPRGS
jgi:hypothetical protein